MKTLEAAELNGECAVKMIPIYVSLYQTYIDNKDYKEALEYMKKEYELVKDDSKESASTLLSISNILDLSGADFWEVETYFKKSLEEVRKVGDLTIESSIMKKYVKFCQKRNMTTIADMLEQEAIGKGIDLNHVESSEDFECSEDILGLDNDVELDLILSTDAESSSDERLPKSTDKNRKSTRQKKQAVKKNAKGETKLHEAAINGNYHLAKLLLDQGHTVNVRDHAGWLPLHEAANHGYRDIVELLLDHGASINDKGGASCEGITPIHDAASNGHLTTVLLLLERGAKPTMKTNSDKTALDLLLDWYTNNKISLTSSEKELYNEIKFKLTEQCERAGIEIKSRNIVQSSTGAYQNLNPKHPTSQLNHSRSRYHAILSEDDDSEEEESNYNETKEKENNQDNNTARNAREEYKTVMKKLKNPQRQTFVSETFEPKRKSALLNEHDVDIDNWLEDDLEPTKKKSKISLKSSPTPTATVRKPLPKKQSNNSIKSSESGNELNEMAAIELSDDENNDNENNKQQDESNAFDVVMNSGRGLATKSNRRLERKKSDSRASSSATTSQSSLLEKGFSRFVELELTLSPKKSSRESIQPQPESVDKQIIIKVQIEDERVIVPMNRETIESSKISWLAEEASDRYYR